MRLGSVSVHMSFHRPGWPKCGRTRARIARAASFPVHHRSKSGQIEWISGRFRPSSGWCESRHLQVRSGTRSKLAPNQETRGPFSVAGAWTSTDVRSTSAWNWLILPRCLLMLGRYQRGFARWRKHLGPTGAGAISTPERLWSNVGYCPIVGRKVAVATHGPHVDLLLRPLLETSSRGGASSPKETPTER